MGEFVNMCAIRDGKAVSTITEEQIDALIAKYEALFSYMDKDKNESLSGSEIYMYSQFFGSDKAGRKFLAKDGLKSLGFGEEHFQELKQVFAALDRAIEARKDPSSRFEIDEYLEVI